MAQNTATGLCPRCHQDTCEVEQNCGYCGQPQSTHNHYCEQCGEYLGF